MECRITYHNLKFDGKILECNKYLYHLPKKLTYNKLVWICIEKKKGCKAKVYSIDGKYLGVYDVHNHPQDEGKIHELIFVNELKRTVRENPGVPLLQLYKTCMLAATNSKTSTKLPSFRNVRHVLTIERNKIKEGTNSSPEPKNDDANLLPNEMEETGTPDVEMQCSDSTAVQMQDIASTSLSDNSNIVVKQEIIETELKPSAFDDSSFHSSFTDGPSETQIDGQGPSTSYVADSEFSNSIKDILPSEHYGVGEASTSSQGLGIVKIESAFSLNSGDSDKNDASSFVPSTLNVPDPDNSEKDKPVPPGVPHSVINVTCSGNLPIKEPVISSHVTSVSASQGFSCLPQSSNIPNHERSVHNESTQPKVQSYSNQSFRPGDKFDVFGEFIASKLRNLDPKSRDFVQRAFSDLIYKAELGMFSKIDQASCSSAQSQDSSQPTKGSENPQASSGKENIQPSIPSHMSGSHAPSDCIILSHESSSRDRTIQPSHRTKSTFPPSINNDRAEPMQITVASPIHNQGPPGSFPGNTSTFSSAQTRISSHTVLPSAPPILNAPNSWNNTPLPPGNPFHHRSRDEFDTYGDFIASKLRNLDPRSCVFVQTAFADILFKAELGRFAREVELRRDNDSNDFLRNNHSTNAVGSLKNLVSNLSSYGAQPRFSSTSSGC